MPYIQLRDRQYPIGQGQLRVGTSAYADVRVPGEETDAPQALVDVGADAQAAIRRGSPGAVVKVNGVLLGPEPTPLIHGDKIEIGGVELLFGDDRSAGSTQYLGAPRAAPKVSAPAIERATATTGGRLVSLVDGREYTIPAAGVTIGRDASCEIVVPSTEVSRRHAMIAPGDGGYIISDLSTNGVLVNGERVNRTRILGRGDLIRIGGEEFRFHADQAPRLEVADGGASSATSVRTSVADEAVVATGASSHDNEKGAGVPSAPIHPAALAEEAAGVAVGAAPGRPKPALAVLEIVNEGVLKGKRFEVRTALTHVGRGEHNDICVPDDSVSDSHAKIQKRETGWYVVDMDSTNGTYVGGRRISGEKHLVGSPDIRFGGIKMIFQVAAEPLDDAKGTRAIAGMRPARVPATTGRAAAAAVTAPAEVAASLEEKPARGLGWIWIGVVVLVIGAVFFMLGGRA